MFEVSKHTSRCSFETPVCGITQYSGTYCILGCQTSNTRCLNTQIRNGDAPENPPSVRSFYGSKESRAHIGTIIHIQDLYTLCRSKKVKIMSVQIERMLP